MKTCFLETGFSDHLYIATFNEKPHGIEICHGVFLLLTGIQLQ